MQAKLGDRISTLEESFQLKLSLLEEERRKCLMCGKETQKVLFSKAIVKIYICSIESLREYHKPITRFKLRIQKRLKEGDGWLD